MNTNKIKKFFSPVANIFTTYLWNFGDGNANLSNDDKIAIGILDKAKKVDLKASDIKISKRNHRAFSFKIDKYIISSSKGSKGTLSLEVDDIRVNAGDANIMKLRDFINNILKADEFEKAKPFRDELAKKKKDLADFFN